MLDYQDLMRGIRAAIEAGAFADFRAAFCAARGLPEPAC
jgi:queuine/archaeosine tRNA-ribosyltransferase